MKYQPIDDTDVKNAFCEASSYAIQTDAQDILKRASAPKKRFPYFPVFTGVGALALAASLSLVFLLPKDEPHNEPALSMLSPAKNASLAKEILSFHSFMEEENGAFSLRPRLQQSDLSESDFLLGVDGYESIESGVRGLFSSSAYSFEDADAEGYSYDGVTYDRRCEIKDGSTLIATYYYVLSSSSIEDGETKKEYEGLYQEGEKAFEVHVSLESEEDETEVTSLFVPRQENGGWVHLLEKEQEYEGQASESSYTHAKYASMEDYKKGEPLSVLSYEFEDGVLEASFETGDDSYEFADIKKTGECSYSFVLEEMEGSSASDIVYALTYSSSGERHYVSGEFETVRF